MDDKWGDYMTGKIQKKILMLLIVLFGMTGIFSSFEPQAQAAGSFNAFDKLPSTLAKPKKNSPRILFVGNSLTFTNDLPKMVEQLCKKSGINARVEQVTKGAHTLNRFAFAASGRPIDKQMRQQLMSQLKKKKWDYVVLQGQRHEAVTDVADMRKAVAALEPLIKKAGAQMVLYETWAPEKGHFDYNGFDRIASNPDEYQSKIASTYYSLAEKYKCALSPAGIAFARGQEIYPDIELFSSDKLHPSAAGTYLSACTMYATLFGKSPEGISYYPPISGKNTKERAQIGKKLQALAADVTVRGKSSNNAVLKFSDTHMTLKTNTSKKLNYILSPKGEGTRVTYWKSDNPKVVKVDEDGKVTGCVVGSANITAILNNGKKAVCKVAVVQGNINLGVGEKYKLQFDKTYKWSSSNPKIAIVKDNTIIAKKSGTVTFTGENSGGTVKIKVTVKSAPGSIKMNKEKTVAVGRTAKLSVDLGSGMTVNGVKFSSSNPKIVSVDANGYITGKRAGKAKITAKTYNGKQAVCIVRVINQAKNIESADGKNVIRLQRGRTKQVKLRFYPSNTSVKRVEWKVSNKKIISVTQNGKVKGLKKGVAMLTAKTTDGSNLRLKIKVIVK